MTDRFEAARRMEAERLFSGFRFQGHDVKGTGEWSHPSGHDAGDWTRAVILEGPEGTREATFTASFAYGETTSASCGAELDGRSLGPWTTSFGDGTVQPLVLTNASCEHAHGNERMFREAGLAHGEFDGEFYPLTDAEAAFIGEDTVDAAEGFTAMTGYSALYKGEKFLMPTIEVQFGNGITEEEALSACWRFFEKTVEAVEGAGGHVFVDENDMPDRHVIRVLIPFAHAMEHASDFESWKRHLSTALLADASATPSP